MIAHDPTTPRLFADFAAVPTPAERRGARRYWRTAQADMFATPAELVTQAVADALACPVCAGDHPGPCKLGDALELELNTPELVAARRAMFEGFGWGS